MSKRLTVFLLLLLGVVLLLAQTTRSEIKLTATKVELSGEVKLVWTKPLNAAATTQYELYRAKLPDTTTFSLIFTTSDTFHVDVVPPVVSPLPQLFVYKVVAKTGLNIEQSNIIIVSVPGFPLVGSFRLEGKVDDRKVKLAWQVPPVRTPISYYLVYRAAAGGFIPPSLDNAQKIDSTNNLISVSDVPETEGFFAFFVRAKLSTGEFLTSTWIVLTIRNRPNHDEIKFVSEPPRYGQMNKKYEYTAKAVSNDPTAVIRYSGAAKSNNQLPVESGFKIDSVTGIVAWTPNLKGYYLVNIFAKSNKGGEAKQEFMVSVAGGNGIIQGKVTDTLMVGIPKVIVEVLKTENDLVASFNYTAVTDMNGNYRIARLDPGSYKVHAISPSPKFSSQWYDGKRNAHDADVISVSDSPNVTIANFKLRGGIGILPKSIVGGKVTDTLGLAINDVNTRVVFVRAEFALNTDGGVDIDIENFRKYFDINLNNDFRLEGNSEYVFKTRPDSLGNYKLELPAGRYIAFARAKGYAAEFYKESSGLLSADIINVDPRFLGLRPPVNFTLAPLPPVVLGEIKGSVLDSVKDVGVRARVLAIRDRWRFNDIHRIGRIYVTDTDSLGAYSFNDLLPGTYVVLAVPLGNYAPAFYSNDSLRMHWLRAMNLDVNGNSYDGINIYVRPIRRTMNGYASISGNVAVSAGNGESNTSIKAGSIVFATNGDEVAGYAVTDVSGNYAINGLAPGSYSVSVDKFGYQESSSLTVNTMYAVNGDPMSSGSANFTLNSVTSVSTVPSVHPSEYILDQNYPNPFNPATTISYSLPNAGDVSLKVYNVVGQEVAVLIHGYQIAGRYNVTFNASNLASGVYFYRLGSGSFNIVKKMMLIK